ncbi:MAG: hypothetical protein EOM11_07450 [Erysipelotrichia bacterium]|nr:hypothetical protein [Erysipelotrichia bacterium]
MVDKAINKKEVNMQNKKLNTQTDCVNICGCECTYEDLILRIRCYSSVLDLLQNSDYYDVQITRNAFYIISVEIENLCDYLMLYA